MELTTPELERLSAVIARRSGMVFPAARWPFLKNRARAVMTRFGITSGGRWTEQLEASGEERGGLYATFEQALQIHETSFFRYEGYHRVLRDAVIPQMNGDRLRIWSVGCSTGQEPYSIAMTVSESLGPAAAAVVEILAGDASPAAVARATRGVYSPADVASVPPGLLDKYFVRRPEGFAVVPAIRGMVRFFRHDIRRGLAVGTFQAVFCCNVLLYFDATMKRQILERLAGALRPRGYLFVGHADGITPSAEQFDARHLPAGFIYRRI